MDLKELKKSEEVSFCDQLVEEESLVSLEAEIPEVLYNGLKEFISSNPNWDQYEVMSSALANSLYQNGCTDRAVTEKYLNDLFTVSQH